MWYSLENVTLVSIEKFYVVLYCAAGCGQQCTLTSFMLFKRGSRLHLIVEQVRKLSGEYCSPLFLLPFRFCGMAL